MATCLWHFTATLLLPYAGAAEAEAEAAEVGWVQTRGVGEASLRPRGWTSDHLNHVTYYNMGGQPPEYPLLLSPYCQFHLTPNPYKVLQ